MIRVRNIAVGILVSPLAFLVTPLVLFGLLGWAVARYLEALGANTVRLLAKRSK